MTIQFYIILCLMTVILQTSDVIKVFDLVNQIKPDFILMAVIYINLREKESVIGELTAFLMGMTTDILSGGLIGLNAFTFTVIAFVINTIKENITVEKYFPVFLFVATATIANEFLFLLFQRIFVGEIMFFKNLFTLAIPGSLYTGLLAPLLYFGLDKILVRVRLWKK
jgi:rod shape-determining protein MreD